MKKIASLLMIVLLAFAVLGCDFLSTIYALKDFSVEYRTYNQIYADAPQSTIDATTEITVVETNIEGLETALSHVYAMFDKTNNRTFLDETRRGERTVSVFQSVDDLIVEYVIADTVVTPRIPEGSANTSEGIFNMDEQFSFQDLDKERKTGAHSYAFDLPLRNLVKLDKVLDMVEELKALDPDAASLNAAIAQVEISFETVESVIDIHASLTEHRLEFEGGLYAVLTIVNHTIVKIPDPFEFPDVFSEDYAFVPVDDIRLATKPYLPDTEIRVTLAETGGWIRIELTSGVYTIVSDQWGCLSESHLQATDQSLIPYDAVGSIQVTIDQDGTYFFRMVPYAYSEIALTFFKQTPAE